MNVSRPRLKGLSLDPIMTEDRTCPPQNKNGTPVPPAYYYAVPQHVYDESQVDLRPFWDALVNGKWIVVICFVLASVCSVVVAYLIPPVYRATAVLVPVEEDKGTVMAAAGAFGNLASLAGFSLGGGGSRTDVAIATLKSQKFLVQFIADNELMPVLYSELWDEKAREWAMPAGESPPSPFNAYLRFVEDILRTSVDQGTGLVRVSIEWSDPKVAAEWVNLLVVRLNSVMRERAVADARRSIEYLQRESQQTSSIEVRQAIFGLMESQVKKAMYANTREDFVFSVLDPAVPPEPGMFVWPNRKLIVAGGAVIGGLVGILVALVIGFRGGRA